MSSLDLSKLKVPDLKKELKLRGLSTTGNKNELLERLQSALHSDNSVSPETVEDFEEHLLNEDDDDEHLETNESVISDLDNDLNDPLQNKSLKRKVVEISDDNKNTAPKRVILNRNNSNNDGIKTDEDEKKEDENSGEPKVVKLSELTVKERLEMRAKKFGIKAFTTDAKKAARAERFGGSEKNYSSNSIIKSIEAPNVDLLKQRAQRFGTNVSSVMSKLETEEKMEQRKARFGEVNKTIDKNGSLSAQDKAKLRLERFSQPLK